MKSKSKKGAFDDLSSAETKDVGLVDASVGGPIGCIVYVSLAASDDQGRCFRLEQGEAVIGREKDCDLVIDDESVSRRHVKLAATSEGIVVEDLGSTNGITYLGKRIEKATLRPGARIDVGQCRVDLLPLYDSGSIPLSSRESYAGLRGTSLSMRRLYSMLQMLETAEAPVLIEGETGTGKELVARALHQAGLRSRKPFVVIDCGNVPAELIESELFGHRKGAFTGAVADREGAFEAAHGGTVFLDELGELPLELQPKLLRVLETGQVKRIGEVQLVPVDVRIVAATQRNLEEEVARGHFRSDLYYRVAVVHIHLPPLRERREDIPLLAEYLARQVSVKKLKRFPPEAEELLMHHDWPGNVRELRNVVHRTLALGVVGLGVRPEQMHPAELGRTDAARTPEPAGDAPMPEFRRARERFEHDYLTNLWSRCRGNLSEGARLSGLDRKSLRKLLRRHGLYKDTK